MSQAPAQERLTPRQDPALAPPRPVHALVSRLTTVPALTLALLGVTLLVAGPFQALDEAAHGHWAHRLTPGLAPFIQHMLDPIAGQAVCLPVLVAVAVTLAWRNRTWQPIWCVAAVELAFYGGVGFFKVLLARPAPTQGDSSLFDGGLWSLGWSGISFPSGHAAEAVLIYGMAVYLIGRWTAASERTLRVLRWAVGIVSLNAVAVSYYLGWHWVSDLVGGLIVGALLLRLLMAADSRDWVHLSGFVRARLRRAAPAPLRVPAASATVGDVPTTTSQGAG